jgi:hypothetical protein
MQWNNIYTFHTWQNYEWRKVEFTVFGFLSTKIQQRMHKTLYVMRFHPLRTRTEFGARVFSSAAPKIWNSLPLDLRLSSSNESSRSNLKTY